MSPRVMPLHTVELRMKDGTAETYEHVENLTLERSIKRGATVTIEHYTDDAILRTTVISLYAVAACWFDGVQVPA